MAVYSEGPAEYAEVTNCRSTQQSPSPYATATLIGGSKLITSDPHRFNMFYTTDIYPPTGGNGGVDSNTLNNNNYNRSIHSESYCNPNGNNNKVNIVENRMANTMMPNMFNQHHQQQQHNASKTGSNKRNRLKLMKPQNFRINFGGSQGEQLYVKVGDMSALEQGHQQPQMPAGAYTWNPQNFNIYENHLHRQEQAQGLAMTPETETKMINCD